MITQRLGPSLDVLLTACGGKFSLKTTLMVMMQLMLRIESLHTAGYVYRDLKPENILMGHDDECHRVTLYLIDFGMSCRYRDDAGRHLNKRTDPHDFAGSYRYAAIEQHRGATPSRRDDLESMGYMMLFMLQGSVPWHTHLLNVPEGADAGPYILHKKKTTSISDMCRDVPEVVAQFMTACSHIDYDEQPPYSKLLLILQQAILKNKFDLDFKYDWMQLDTNPAATTTTARDSPVTEILATPSSSPVGAIYKQEIDAHPSVMRQRLAAALLKKRQALRQQRYQQLQQRHPSAPTSSS
jgi:serine/threonine protein kinase